MASVNYLSQTGVAELVAQIKAKYATKTSIPTKVSDLTNDSNFQTDTQVASSIASAIAGVTQFDYQIVESLPATGVKGVIYLIANSGSGQNIYDEYIWIVENEQGRYEKFGEKMVELVEYKGDGTYVAVVDGTGADAGKKVIQLTAATQASLALADSAIQSVTSTGSTVVVSGAGTTKNLEVAQSIVDGAAAGATALQGVTSTGSTVTITGDGTTKNLEVSSTIVAGATAGATAVQPEDLVAMTNTEIDALFTD